MGTVTNVVEAASHPIETAKAIGGAIKDSFERDVVEGNAYSQSYWLTNTRLTIATAFIGTKGMGTVSKVNKFDTPDTKKPKPSSDRSTSSIPNPMKDVLKNPLHSLLPRLNQGYELALATGDVGAGTSNPFNGKNVSDSIKEKNPGTMLSQSDDRSATAGTSDEGRKPSVDNFNPQTATTKQKGNYGEIISTDNLLNNQSLKDAGYDLIPIGRGAPSSIDDKIVKGIDGLYENRNEDSEIRYVIDEAKFGSSQLGKTKDGPQMSDDWLTGSETGKNRILKAVDGDEKLADKIIEALNDDEVERVLSKVDSSGNVETFKLNAKGEIVGRWP